MNGVRYFVGLLLLAGLLVGTAREGHAQSMDAAVVAEQQRRLDELRGSIRLWAANTRESLARGNCEGAWAGLRALGGRPDSSPLLPAGTNEELKAEKTRLETELLEEIRKRCGQQTAQQAPQIFQTAVAGAVQVQIAGGAVRRNANATISRLKSSVGNAEIPNVSNVKQNDSGATGELRIQTPIGAAPSGVAADSPFCRFIQEMARRGLITGCGSSLDFGYRYTGIDNSTSGAGPQIPVLLFTGFGVQGTAGNNSIPGGYSVLNQPHTYNYGYNFNQHQFDLAARLPGANVGPNTVIQPIVGFRGMFTGVNDSFATNVTFPNGFPVNALHTTSTDMVSGGLFGGVNLYHAPDGVPFVFVFSARGGFDVNRAESDVAFGIRTPLFNDVQQITVKDTKTTPYVRGEAGVAGNVLGASLQATIFAEHGGAFPNVEIPGGGQRPYINFTNETNFGGRFAVTIPLVTAETILSYSGWDTVGSSRTTTTASGTHTVYQPAQVPAR